MRILGIDPGLNHTGYGVVDVDEGWELHCRAAGVIRPEGDVLEIRLRILHDEITTVLHEFIPDAMAIEDLYSTYEFPKTAILMGHARGVIFLAAGQRAVPVTGYAPTEVKRAVAGNGRATKAQMQSMVQRLLRLPTRPESDHVADALAMAICHAYRERGLPVLRRR